MSRAVADWQVFDFDLVEKAFCTILTGLGIKAFQKRSIEKRTTPAVEVRLETNGVQGGQFVRFPNARHSQVQPFVNFFFTLNVAAISERISNGISHAELVARTRAYLQYYWLTNTFTETVSPYHSITEIREIDSPSDIAPDDNLDITQLTFTGIFNIRDTSWPLTIT